MKEEKKNVLNETNEKKLNNEEKYEVNRKKKRK